MFVITTFVLSSLLIILLSFFVERVSTGRLSRKLPPGSFGWPFVGESLSLLKATANGVPERFVIDRLAKHRITSAFKTSIFGERVVFLCGPAANKFILSDKNEKFVPWWPGPSSKMLGPSILTMKGEEGLLQRKILGTFFGPDNLREFVGVIDEVARKNIEYQWKVKEQVETLVAVKAYVFESACRLFVNVDDPRLFSRLSINFNIFLKGFFGLPINLPGTRFHLAKKAANALTRDFMMLVNQRRMELERKKALPKQDLLTHLLAQVDENGKFMPEIVISKNLLSLLFAGHESTSCTLTLAIKYLGELPHVYEKVLAEQQEIAAAKPPGQLLDWEDVQKMRYTRNVVFEVLRLYPATNTVFREAIDDFEFTGYNIPKGWKIACSASLVHKDPVLFSSPESFDESRFDNSGPAPYTYLPFGGGPRMCLGKELACLEILVFLHHLVVNFKWDPAMPDERIRLNPVPTPAKGLPVRLLPRK
ncbi:hypothetical protein MLD38_017113 [Melastoma candidum]|uniref:Uncharacterized protein n=1 Tax=Melastoma candidum TaxID=119954 RepID=A0ACB9QT27_9MYRT|nr:hypothetical protein MLD38_017113 [Melastoma candidum]